MVHDATERVLGAARRVMQERQEPLLLAVSGGLDSMALLDAMVRVCPGRIAAVATFDHGTGEQATRAAAHVVRVASAAGLRVHTGAHTGVARNPDGDEVAWRDARYAFLRGHARRYGASVVTAHTLDDQVETVLMRVMRGAGSRGIAGLFAGGDIIRPFLDVTRAQLAEYAGDARLAWLEDPSNSSMTFARNRVRRDLLPAMRRAAPDLDATLLALARRSAAWRAEVDAFVVGHVGFALEKSGELVVAAADLRDYDRGALAILWSSLAARAGLSLDRRGTRRIAAFTMGAARSGHIPLAGGWCLRATRDVYILGRTVKTKAPPAAALPTNGGEWLDWGRFRFRLAPSANECSPDGASMWMAAVCADSGGVVRAWSAGDRLEPAGGQPRRRITRYLSDVRMHSSDRAGWPVVVAGDEVVWIPGVRRSDAATDRSGRPVRHYICERIDR